MFIRAAGITSIRLQKTGKRTRLGCLHAQRQTIENTMYRSGRICRQAGGHDAGTIGHNETEYPNWPCGQIMVAATTAVMKSHAMSGLGPIK